jgi:hypothetical protein
LSYIFSACNFQVGKIKVENSNNITISSSEIFSDSLINVNSLNFRLLDNIIRDTLRTANSGTFSNFYRGNDLTYAYSQADSLTYSLIGNISGSGTANYVSKFSSTNGLSSSTIFDNGSFVGINTTSAVGSNRLVVNGAAYANGDITSTANMLVPSGGYYSLSSSSPNFSKIYRDGGIVLESNTFKAKLADGGSFTNDGSITGSSIIRSGGTSSQSLQADGSVLTLTSGTYTPTLTNTTNISSSSASVSTYTRVGNIVTVYATASATPSSGGTASELTFSLPIATSSANATLTGSGIDAVPNRFAVTSGSSGTTVGARFTSGSGGTSHTIYVTFQYTVN